MKDSLQEIGLGDRRERAACLCGGFFLKLLCKEDLE